MKVLVLASKSVAINNLLLRDLESPLMIPFKGRPLFYNFQEMFPGLIINYAVSSEANLTSNLIYSQAKKANVILVPKKVCSGTTGDVLLYSLNILGFPNDLLILYGDNLYEFENKKFPPNTNSIFTFKTTDRFERYSYFSKEKNHVVFAPIDKKLHDVGRVDEAQAKETFLNTGALWVSDTSKIQRVPGKEILSLCARLEFEVVQLKSWKDLGFQDLILRETYDFASRRFNIVRRSTDGTFITKISNNPKLLKEIQHLDSIPSDFKYLFPRITHDVENEREYRIEFWPLRALSEYFCFWQMHETIWFDIFRKISEIVSSFFTHTVVTDAQNRKDLAEVYVKMVSDRTSQYSGNLRQILELPNLSLNGRNLLGFEVLRNNLVADLLRIGSTIVPSFYHGDMFLGNILYSPEYGTIKLIDPKGSLIDSVLTLGDVRYDLAKLSHSINYGYDFVNYGLAKLEEASPCTFYLRFTAPSNTREIQKIFNRMVLANLDKAIQKDVMLLTSMLFLNMVPLHEDSENHQKIYLLMGLKILNDYYCPGSDDVDPIWTFLGD